MNPSIRSIGVGVALLFLAIALDATGSLLQSLPILILSFALAIAGAVVCVRGVIEFLADRA